MTGFFIILIVLVALVALLSHASVKAEQPSLPPGAEEGETFETSATVLDGDTVRVPELDMDLRLARVDAPEKGEHGAERAEDRLAEKLDNASRVNMELVEKGKWGRPVVELWADGENVSDWMLEEGLADRY